MPADLPAAFVATRLIAERRSADRPLFYVGLSENRAGEIARLLSTLAPDTRSAFLPAWDCLPYDRASPSAAVMGARMDVLRRLKRGEIAVLITTPQALIQRTPPSGALKLILHLATGEPFDPVQVECELVRLGYRREDKVEEPGAFALRGEVLDVFGAADVAPHRLDLAEGRVTAIRVFDPLTQRSSKAVEALAIGPASEVILPPDRSPSERPLGLEHALAAFYPQLETAFELGGEGSIFLESGVETRGLDLIRQAAAAYRERAEASDGLEDADPEQPPSRPEHLYLTPEVWTAHLESAIELAMGGYAPVPNFAVERAPNAALSRFVRAEREAGRRVVLCAAVNKDIARLTSAAERGAESKASGAADWVGVQAAPAGALLTLDCDARAGFIDAQVATTLISAADLLGSRARSAHDAAVATPWDVSEEAFAPGDAVIHEAHGLGVLRGLEIVDTAALGRREMVRIDYAKDARLLAPIEELAKVWRYGSEEAEVSLDRLDTDGWLKRRAGIEGEIARTARDLVDLAKARDAAQASKLEPPRRDYERFAAGFPFTPTRDQLSAVDAVLGDLASGRPMDRLVVGDVGFGKTEVAMRGAAAAVLAGKQVALAAPTTVLVRQHVESFRRRFAELGVEVAHLSRLVGPAEARAVKAGLADASVRLVIGTQALAGKDVTFADLGLLIVDEEHRFGAADKAKLKALGEGVHVLLLSATPIPRTLQQALVGLQDLSVIATPPARRRPIRTSVQTLDPLVIKTALTREKARGGQSFVVAPRIEDLDPMRERLAELVPRLKVVAAHGKMPAAEVDEAMVGFAEGRGDVLLATNIIESGLDVPRANTMLICDADRFGLAQLHQLRGRVGRGRVQGVCYLFTDPERPLAEATATRLRSLAAHDRLGAGLALSARDLDLRGAGELMGEVQAGHVNLIGLGLYQHLLELAIRAARGEAVDDWTPEIKIDVEGAIPDDYVPEEALRLNLYARLARAVEPEAADALADEIEDRFGPSPEPVSRLLDLARLRALARRWSLARIDAGPQAIAYTPRPGSTALASLGASVEADGTLSWRGDRLIQGRPTKLPDERLQLALMLLGELE